MESLDVVIEYIKSYGMIFLFVMVYLEYLNFPGLPAGIIMPAIGLLIARSEIRFIYALIVSVGAGLLGSGTLYAIGYFIGNPMMDKAYNKYKKMRNAFEKCFSYIEKYGNKGIFISRLIPVARTLISLVAGTMRMDFMRFICYSTIGITLWNTGFILSGYLLGIWGR